jgi:hypothetical protein
MLNSFAVSQMGQPGSVSSLGKQKRRAAAALKFWVSEYWRVDAAMA